MAYGFHDFTAGDTFGASDADGIIRQTTMNFADAAARDAALTGGILEEGMRAYTRDNNTYYAYDGSAWVIESEPVQSWTPTVTQSGAVTKTVTWGFYRRTGGIFVASCRLDFTGSGTASNEIVVTSPITHIVAGGSMTFYDTSGGFWRHGYAVNKSTTTFNFTIDEGTDYYGKAGGDGITSGDVLIMTVTGNY